MYDKYPTAKVNGPWYVFNPAEASKMMQAAGFTAPKPLTMELASFYNKDQFSGIVIPGINNSLKEVKITFKDLGQSDSRDTDVEPEFQGPHRLPGGPPGFSMDQWLSPFYHSKGSLNYGSIEDAALDALLLKQRAETNPATQKEIWNQINTLIHDQVYRAWWPVGLNRTAWHNYVLNYRPNGLVGNYLC